MVRYIAARAAKKDMAAFWPQQFRWKLSPNSSISGALGKVLPCFWELYLRRLHHRKGLMSLVLQFANTNQTQLKFVSSFSSFTSSSPITTLCLWYWVHENQIMKKYPKKKEKKSELANDIPHQGLSTPLFHSHRWLSFTKGFSSGLNYNDGDREYI